jgi:hypothetical protein
LPILARNRASLLPKLRDQYAEFLDHVSLVHLRLLASPTCVGLRYGRSWHCHTQLFSTVDSRRLAVGLPLGLAVPSRHWLPNIYAVRRPIHTAAPPSFQCPLRGRNVHNAGPESSPAVHRLRLWGLALGSASPCADHHGAGILGLSVQQIFTVVCAYSFRHPHFWSLQGNVSTAPSLFPERSPTPDQPSVDDYQGHASAGRLIPTILGAFTLDW